MWERIKHKKQQRHMYMLSDIDPELLARIRLYAIGKEIPIYKAFEYLILKGLASEARNLSQLKEDGK